MSNSGTSNDSAGTSNDSDTAPELPEPSTSETAKANRPWLSNANLVWLLLTVLIIAAIIPLRLEPALRQLSKVSKTREILKTELNAKEKFLAERTELSKEIQGKWATAELARHECLPLFFFDNRFFSRIKGHQSPIGILGPQMPTNDQGLAFQYKVPDDGWYLAVKIAGQAPSTPTWMPAEFDFDLESGHGSLMIDWKNEDNAFQIDFTQMDATSKRWKRKSVTLDRPRDATGSKSRILSGNFFSLPGDVARRVYFQNEIFYRQHSHGVQTLRFHVELKSKEAPWTPIDSVRNWDAPNIESDFVFDQIEGWKIPVSESAQSNFAYPAF